jgi:hypothetical protein
VAFSLLLGKVEHGSIRGGKLAMRKCELSCCEKRTFVGFLSLIISEGTEKLR